MDTVWKDNIDGEKDYLISLCIWDGKIVKSYFPQYYFVTCVINSFTS